jgi:tRNA(fMet)-specific endonuclease VapC
VKILLDTNAYSALVQGHQGVAQKVRQADEILFSAVVVGELLFGFHNGTRYEKNRRELDQFLENPHVRWMTVTLETCERFGQIAAALRRKGRPIPTNDIWIAAHAQEAAAEFLSFDDHFTYVEGLDWRLME